VSSELVEQLIARGVLVFFFDALGEWEPKAQERVRKDAEELKLKRLVISSRTPIDCSWCEHIVMSPLPLNSQTLLHFITMILLPVHDVPAVAEIVTQFELGRRLAAIGKTMNEGFQLTPLLVRIFLDRAVEVLRRDGDLDELPSRPTEIYLDFVRLLLSSHPSADRDEYLSAVKVLALLTLGTRFVPGRVPYAAASAAILAASIKNPTKCLDALVAAGILSEEEEGLTRSVRFVLDPLAEVCSAYAYAERCGSDLSQWAQLGRNLASAGGLAAGFDRCLKAVITTYAAKGICSAAAAAQLSSVQDAANSRPME